jgi:hypothetical protein
MTNLTAEDAELIKAPTPEALAAHMEAVAKLADADRRLKNALTAVNNGYGLDYRSPEFAELVAEKVSAEADREEAILRVLLSARSLGTEAVQAMEAAS